MSRICTGCRNELNGRFCVVCGRDSTLYDDWQQATPPPQGASTPQQPRTGAPSSLAFRRLEIVSLDIAPELAAKKDEMMLRACLELQFLVAVAEGSPQQWVSTPLIETVAMTMGRGKITGVAPLLIEFPPGPAELYIAPTTKSFQALKTLYLRAEPFWKRRWTAEQDHNFIASMIHEMGWGCKHSLSPDKQSLKVALTLSSNRIVPHDVA